MKSAQKLILSGVAAAAFGMSGSAVAATRDTIHNITIQLPGGGTEQISYTDNVMPDVVVLPSAYALLPSAFLEPSGGLTQVGAKLDRIAGDIDRDMASAIKKANAQAAVSFDNLKDMNTAAFKSMPAGSESYSFVSTMSDGKTCSRSVQITSMGVGKKPKIVSHSSGNCANTKNSRAVPDVTASFWDFPNDARPVKVSVHVPSSTGTARKPA